VLDTNTSSGAASAKIRAPVWTAMPLSFSPITSHSPVWTPARILMPNALTAPTRSAALLAAPVTKRRKRTPQ